jgi:hypothetical protein
MLDSLWQSVIEQFRSNIPLIAQYVFWLLGAMCSIPESAGKLVAVFRVAESTEAAVTFRLTAANVAAKTQFISN